MTSEKIFEYFFENLTFRLVAMATNQNTLQSLYNASRYDTVLVITRPGLGSQMVIFLKFLYKSIPL